MQSVISLRLLRLGSSERGFSRFDSKLQFLILRTSDTNLLVQGGKGRLRFFQSQLVIIGIDFEKQIAFFD